MQSLVSNVAASFSVQHLIYFCWRYIILYILEQSLQYENVLVP